MKGINLRVYRRNDSYLSCVFNDNAVSGIKLEDLKIYDIEDKEKKNPFVYTSGVNQKEQTVQVVIDHQINKLNPSKTYVLVFDFKQFEINIKIYPAGVLPLFDKESVDRIQHLYGWVESEKKWCKLKAVKDASGDYVLAVKSVK